MIDVPRETILRAIRLLAHTPKKPNGKGWMVLLLTLQGLIVIYALYKVFNG